MKKDYYKKTGPRDPEIEKQYEEDPRIEAFTNSYTYCPGQNSEKVICLSQMQLRSLFQAHILPSGHDPLITILKKLRENGFYIEMAIGKDDFVLPVVKTSTKRLTE